MTCTYRDIYCVRIRGSGSPERQRGSRFELIYITSITSKKRQRMRSSSSKHVGVGVSSRMLTLHQRLRNALNLGHSSCRDCGKKRQKWHCEDIELQRVVLRSLDAFLDCISSETSQHPIVKDSVDDMVEALESILELQSESVLKLASHVAAKIVNVLPSSMFQSLVSFLVCPLSSLLCSQQLQVAVSCATALNTILSNLNTKQEKEVWEILKERNAVHFLVNNVKNFSMKDKPVEYFQEMASLTSKILWRWPPARFPFWTDSKLLDVLDNLRLRPESSLKVAVLQLYSSLALCGCGAKKLLENGKGLVEMMLDCMGGSYPHSVQMEGFRLAQCFMINEQGCMDVLKICCGPLVNAIVNEMHFRHFHSGKLSKDQIYLIMEACRLALITRWAGEHQEYFWKAGICTALVGLLLKNFGVTHQSLHHFSIREQMDILLEGLNGNIVPSLRPYIWDILGQLAANCAEDFNPKTHGAELQLNILITCACLAFVESIRSTRQISQASITNTFGNESAIRAVLMMVYSPSKHIASRARFILSETLKQNGKDYTEYSLNTLNSMACGNKFVMPSELQIVVSLASLACYASLPNYREHVWKRQGMKTLLAFLRWWLSNPVYIKRSSLAPHLCNSWSDRACCCSCAEDWDGDDMLLLFSLWALAELMQHPGFCADLFVNEMNFNESHLVKEMKEICMNSYSSGPRWYAAYILSHFGLYGFPNKFGKRIGKAFMDNELSDLELILANEESLRVHKVILVSRCPSLLPPGEQFLKEKFTNSSLPRQEMERSKRSLSEVRLSAHVDYQSLLKVLEYVYLGYLQAGDDHLKKLKLLAKHCDLQPLLLMLYRRNPRWGTLFPTFDLSSALGPAGSNMSDVVLECNTAQLLHWSCCACSASIPHLHVHKVILWSSCDYFRAMFHSGMQESISQTIKVPVRWNSLIKLVSWLYSDRLPKPIFGCMWDNLDISGRLNELQPYVELCWLAEFWLLEDIYEQCFMVVESAMETDRYLSVKVIQLAAKFSQWKLAEIAATYIAPLYHQLRNSGDLDQLDESFIEMVRAASVRLSQELVNQT